MNLIVKHYQKEAAHKILREHWYIAQWKLQTSFMNGLKGFYHTLKLKRYLRTRHVCFRNWRKPSVHRHASSKHPLFATRIEHCSSLTQSLPNSWAVDMFFFQFNRICLRKVNKFVIFHFKKQVKFVYLFLVVFDLHGKQLSLCIT